MASINNKKVNNASMIDPSVIIAAGIDPRTKLPAKATAGTPCTLKNDIARQLEIRDEQDAINRYHWCNLPCDINGQELERLLYYKGQLCFFYYAPLDTFYFMPYALDGTLDFYGRFNTIHPVPMTSGGKEDDDNKALESLLNDIKLKVYYDLPLRDLTYDELTSAAVILRDYTNGLSQTIVPRAQLNKSLLGMEAECLPMMRTALRNGTGAIAMRVGGEDEQSNVQAANLSIDEAILNGQRYIPVVGALEFQELTSSTPAKADEFLMSMQSIDNFRLSLYGIENGGIFDKKSYVNKDQTALNGTNIDSPLLDGLHIRQKFCDIINCIFGSVATCEINESVMNADRNGDGLMYDEQDQTGTMPGDQEATTQNA